MTMLLCGVVTASVVASDNPKISTSTSKGIEPPQSPVVIGWEGLDIQFPSEIIWTSSKVKIPSPDRRTFVYKGTDANGPTQLIISQFGNNFAAKLWDGAGVQWEAIGNIANAVRFNKVFKGEEKHCGGTPPVPPEIQAQFPAGGNEGGVAGGECIDSETLDVMVAYSPCALQQFYRVTLFCIPACPPCPDLPPPFDPEAALALLKTAVFLQEDSINESFDNSLISTPNHERHIRIVAIVDTNQVPECRMPTPWNPNPFDPGYSCYQPEFDPEADPQKCAPLVPAWCGESIEFGADLDRISNPANPDYGGLLTQKRDYHRADFVVLLRVSGLEGIAGMARLKAQNSGCVDTTGYCVVDIMSMRSMGHEIGHNLGCCHEPGQGGSFVCSMFPYSFGHRFTVADPNGGSDVEMKTIMAYATGEDIPYYSNPSVLYPLPPAQGEPTGTSQTQYAYWSDNARTIRETFDDARCYRCANEPAPAPLLGLVTCFGSNTKGQSTPPNDLGDCSRVAAGYLHTLAIQSNGTVRAWGAGTTNTLVSPNYGQSLVPVNLPEPPYGDGYPLGTCSDLAAGLYHSVAIRTRIIDGTPENELLNGTVVCWGAGVLGQQSPNYGQSLTPQNLGPCTKVSAGHYHTLALRRDGLVAAWGAGQSEAIFPNLGQSDVPNIGPCTDIAAGGYHSVAIKYGGGGVFVVAWGAGKTNTSYQTEWGQSIVPVTLGQCTRVAAGVFHTVALKVDGTVRAFGAGITDTGPFPRFGQSVVPSGLGICTDIAAGGAYIGSSGSHTLAIKADKTILGWGSNSDLQTTVPPVNSNWIQISAGGLHSVAIKVPTSILPCQGDFNSDRKRDGLDLTFILSAWGTASGDVTGDGTTNGIDMTYLLSGWGPCPP